MEADSLAEAIRRVQQPSAVELFRDELRALLSGRWMNDLPPDDVLPHAREELSQQVEQLRSMLEMVHERQRLSAIREHLSDESDAVAPQPSTWVEEAKVEKERLRMLRKIAYALGALAMPAMAVGAGFKPY